MTDKRFGNRFKECRERLGMTQAQLSEILQLPSNYISLVERGERFPRYDKLILLLNTLGVSADAVFCDVLDHSSDVRLTEISPMLENLSADEKQEILDVLGVMVNHAKSRATKGRNSEK